MPKEHQDFNVKAEFQKDILPHVEAIQKICQQYEISHLMSFCTAHEELKSEERCQWEACCAGGAYGPERTPPEMLMATALLQGGLAEGLRVMVEVTTGRQAPPQILAAIEALRQQLGAKAESTVISGGPGPFTKTPKRVH